jgi:acyl carrier protein
MSFGSQCHDDAQTAVAQIVFDQVRSRLPTGSETDVSLDSSLSELGLDSLDMVEMTLGLEESFGVEIPDSELEDVATVGDAITLIEKKMSVGA